MWPPMKKSTTDERFNGDRVTVLVPKSIHREVKLKALTKDLTVQEAVHQALLLWMKAK